jgi:hypothetical protein
MARRWRRAKAEMTGVIACNRRITLATIVLLCLAGRTSSGQADPVGLGQIRGTVYDSLLAAPLDGAWVSLGDGSRRARSDETGQYLLDSVPAGTQVLMFWRADLDSVGLWSLGDTVSVMAGHQVTRNLAVPSLATLWSRLCGVAWPPATTDSGVVVGLITDAATRAPAAEAWATVYWVATESDAAGRLAPEWRSRAVQTDGRGRFARCGVPVGTLLLLQASRGPFTSGLVDLVLGERGIAFQDVWLGHDSVTAVAADSMVPLPMRGTATLAGSVRGGAGEPLAGAVARLDDVEASAVSGGGGRFVLPRIPAGSQMLTVQRIGYRVHREAVHLAAGDTTTIGVTLWSIVLLDTVRVVGRQVSASVRSRIADRRRAGRGYVRDSTDIGHLWAMRQVFQGFPRLWVTSRGLFGFQLTTLGMSGGGGRWCAPDIYLDGSRADPQILDSYRPADLAAVEFYPGLGAPAEFWRGGQTCGVVLLWTKLYLR